MTEAIIDVAALAKLKAMIGGETEDLAELVTDFVSTLPDQLALMRSSEASQDWAALRIASHSCKSNARDLGASDLAELCAELELRCKTGEPGDVGDLISGIEAAATAAISALDAEDLASV